MKRKEQQQIFYIVALLFGIVSVTLAMLSLNVASELLASQGEMLYALIAAMASVLFFLMGYCYPSKKSIFDKKIDPSLVLAAGMFTSPLIHTSFQHNYFGVQTLLYLIASFILFLGIGGIIHEGIIYTNSPIPPKRRATRKATE